MPLFSSRTLGSMGNTIVTYTGYRYVKQKTVKDILKYACAGSSAYTLGSLTYDVLNTLNVRLPNVLNFALSASTGVKPVEVESEESADLNTAFA